MSYVYCSVSYVYTRLVIPAPRPTQAGYLGLHALLATTDTEQGGHDQGVKCDGERHDRHTSHRVAVMRSILWLMEAHGREWHVPEDITAAIERGQHVQHTQSLKPLEAGEAGEAGEAASWLRRERLMTMLLCLNRVGTPPTLAAEIVGDVVHTEVIGVLEAVAFA